MASAARRRDATRSIQCAVFGIQLSFQGVDPAGRSPRKESGLRYFRNAGRKAKTIHPAWAGFIRKRPRPPTGYDLMSRTWKAAVPMRNEVRLTAIRTQRAPAIRAQGMGWPKRRIQD